VVSQEAFQGGGFEELAMPLFDALFNFACWLTRNREEAEDLVQETYVKALRGFGSFQPGTNFRAWIFRILRNTFLTSRSGLAATRTVPLEEEQAEPPALVEERTPEDVLLALGSAAQLHRALDELPVIFREVLLLVDVEEMSYQEAAESLAIPIGTVMSRLARARRAVRASLAAREAVR